MSQRRTLKNIPDVPNKTTTPTAIQQELTISFFKKSEIRRIAENCAFTFTKLQRRQLLICNEFNYSQPTITIFCKSQGHERLHMSFSLTVTKSLMRSSFQKNACIHLQVRRSHTSGADIFLKFILLKKHLNKR